MDQVRGGVMPRNRAATRDVDRELRGLERKRILAARELVQMAAGLVLPGIRDVQQLAIDQDRAGVARLSAHLGVERRLVEHEEAILAGLDDLEERRVRMGLRVAEKFRRLRVAGAFALG